MRKLKSWLLVLLISGLLAVCEADFLNDYLNDKVFGVDPGPCPEQDGGCLINLDGAEFPPEIGKVEFCLFE